MKYLIAYDIAAPRRLRRVARCLEKYAIRCQKSVFIADVTSQRLKEILDELAGLICHNDDCVQAWRLYADQPVRGASRGTTTPIAPATVVQTHEQTFVIEGDPP